MTRAGQQQVFKLAQRVGANHIDHIVADKRAHRAFANVHVQVVEPELGHARQQRVFKRWVAARHQAPGSGGLRHLAAKTCRLCGVVGRHRTGLGLTGLFFDVLACFAFGFKVARNRGYGLIEAIDVGRDIGRALAGGVGCVNLAEGPRPGVALRSLGRGFTGAVAKTRCGAPGSGRVGIGLRGCGQGKQGRKYHH